MKINIVIRKEGIDLEGTKHDLAKFGKVVKVREEKNWRPMDDKNDPEDAVIFSMEMNCIPFAKFIFALKAEGIDLYRDRRKKYINYYYPAN